MLSDNSSDLFIDMRQESYLVSPSAAPERCCGGLHHAIVTLHRVIAGLHHRIAGLHRGVVSLQCGIVGLHRDVAALH